MMSPTMELRQRQLIIRTSSSESTTTEHVILVLEQKWVNPARPHAPEWRAIPFVDVNGNLKGCDDE